MSGARRKTVAAGATRRNAVVFMRAKMI